MKANMTALLRLMLCAVAAPMARSEVDAAAFDAEAHARRADTAAEKMPAVRVATMETQP